MPGKPRLDKVSEERKVNPHNSKYMNVKGDAKHALGDGIMGQASKPMHVNPCPNYDINRVSFSEYKYKDTPSEAFNYKY